MRTRAYAVALGAAAVLAIGTPAGAVPAKEEVGKRLPVEVTIKQFAAGERNAMTAATGTPTWTAELVRRAKSVIGTPYSYGGMTPAGFDCSGFTRWVYLSRGIELPHSSVEQYTLGGTPGYERIDSMEELQAGDLVFHATGDPVGHAGIYVGDGMFISSTSSEGVQIRSLHDGYWGPLWVGGVRVTAGG